MPALKTSYMKTAKASWLRAVRQSHAARVYGRDTPALLRHHHHNLRNVARQDLVQPRALRPFLEAQMKLPRKAPYRFDQRPPVRLHHSRRQPLARPCHLRKRARLRVRIQTDVSVHASPPLRRTVDTTRSLTGPGRRSTYRDGPRRRRHFYDAFITQPAVIRRILDHMRRTPRPATRPPPTRPRPVLATP